MLLPDLIGPQQVGEFGHSMGLSADFRAVGVPRADTDGVIDAGLVAVYDSDDNLFATITNPYPAANDEFGKVVALSGSTLAVGVPHDDIAGVGNAGAVYVYDLGGPNPGIPTLELTLDSPSQADLFGGAVSIEGRRLIASAHRDDGALFDVGNVFVYDLDSATPTIPALTLPNPDPGTTDWFGWSLDSSGDFVVVGALLDDVGGTDAGGAYVFDLGSPTPTVPVTPLLNPTPSNIDQFGGAVAVSGNIALVGGRLDDVGAENAGSVYVYDLASATPETPFLTIHNPEPATGDQFGHALTLDGSIAVVGAWLDSPGGVASAGSAYVYDLAGAAPTTPLVTLEEPVPETADQFGYSLAVRGTTVLAGARFDNATAGGAYVFDLSSPTPETIAGVLDNLTPAANDRFGFSVSIDGNLMVVGSPLEDTEGIDAGAAFVYDLASGSPQLLATLYSPTPGRGDSFGVAVDISGSRIVVGADRDNTTAIDTGTAYVYDLTSAAPNLPMLTLNSPTPAAEDRFGISVAIDGELVVVGAFQDDSVGLNSGSAHVFDLSSATPAVPEVSLYHPNPVGIEAFGLSVDVSSHLVAVGAPSGFEGAYVFDMNSATPTLPFATLEDPTPTTSGAFGFDVAIDDHRVVVGAPTEDGDLGAAYFYDMQSASPGVAETKLNLAAPVVEDLFGISVAIDGQMVVVGAAREDTTALNAGSAFVYDLESPTPSVPTESYASPSAGTQVQFGDAVALDGENLLIAASLDSTVNYAQGAVYAYITNTLPVIDNQSFEVDEDDDGTTPFATVSAFDAQTSVTFAISGGSGTDTFSIDPHTGEITSNGALDFETIATYSLEVTVEDDQGETAAATISIDVRDVNDAPVAMSPDFGSAPLGAPISEDEVISQFLGVDVPLEVYATDVDTILDTTSFDFDSAEVTIDGSTLMFSDLSEIGASYEAGSGLFTLDPTGVEIFQSMAAGDTASVVLAFRVSDGMLQDVGSASYRIIGVNDAVVAFDDEDSTDEDTAISIDVLANDEDIDNDLLIVTEIEGIPISVGAPVALASGAVVALNVDGTLAYDPQGAFDLFISTANDTFAYTVSDGEATAAANVTVAVTVVNQAPTAVDDLDTTDEDGVLEVFAQGVLANDDDLDDHDSIGGTVFVSMHDPFSALGATVVVNADGSYRYDPTASLSIQALDAGDAVDDTFAYTIVDSQGATSTATVTIRVNGRNDAPVAMGDQYETNEDTALTVTSPGILANDDDVDADHVLGSNVTISTFDFFTALGATVIVTTDGGIQYNPFGVAAIQALNAGETLDDTFRYTITDSFGASSTATVTVTILGLRDEPSAVGGAADSADGDRPGPDAAPIFNPQPNRIDRRGIMAVPTPSPQVTIPVEHNSDVWTDAVHHVGDSIMASGRDRPPLSPTVDRVMGQLGADDEDGARANRATLNALLIWTPAPRR